MKKGNDKENQNNNKFITIICVAIIVCAGIILFVKSQSINLYQNASVPKESITCLSGQYLDGNKCLECPEGNYCVNNIKYTCPAGTGSLAEAITEKNCRSCSIGYYSIGDGNGCQKCPVGTTTDDVGSTSIEDCI